MGVLAMLALVEGLLQLLLTRTSSAPVPLSGAPPTVLGPVFPMGVRATLASVAV